MTSSTKVDEKFEGVENFWAWKYRVMLILEENDLEKFVKEEVAEPKEDEAKANFKKNMIRGKELHLTDWFQVDSWRWKMSYSY